jgi:diguanylate cyclase (GGDEF)-like protein/PAS domain S-box-containing protein
MRLTVRRKLQLLLAGALTAALLLVAVALTWLIGAHHVAAAGRATHALLHDLGAHIDNERRRLVTSAATLAANDEIVATLALLTDYATPEDYRSLIFDGEKSKLAETLARGVAPTILAAAYDGGGMLVAFGQAGGGPDAEGRTGISTWSDGAWRFIEPASEPGTWRVTQAPHGLPDDAAAFGAPRAHAIRPARLGQRLALEAIVPVARMRDGETRTIGWLRLALPLDLSGFADMARQRDMTLELLFSADFDRANKHGLHSEELRAAPSLASLPREHAEAATSLRGTGYMHAAALDLAGGEAAWFVAALDMEVARAEQGRVQGVVLMVLAGSLLLALPLAGWFGRRWIGAPFDTLRAGVHAYTQGRLDTAIELRSGDEFEALAEDFNLLAVALRVREIAIKEAEERWQFALEGADHGVWDWNIASGEVYFSSRWKSMLGHADAEIANRIEEWESRVHPDDLPQARAAIDRHLHGEAPSYRVVIRMRHKDGDWRWIFARGQVTERDADGRPRRMIGTHTDVTEQRRTQERLEDLMAAVAASEAHYRSFFAEAKAVMLLIDPADGRIIDANPAASAFYGYTHAELLALAITDINQLTRAEIEKEMARAIVEKRDHFVFPHRLKDGRVRTVEVYSGPYHHQDRLILYSIVHDITERAEAERVIHEAATVFEATGEAIMITDAQGVIKRVNPAFTATTGYAESEAVGQTPRLLKSGRHDARYYEEMWGALLAEGRWEGEIWDRRKNGEIFPIWQTITAVRDEGGKVVEFVALFIDITQRKRSEEEISYRANYDALTGLPNRNLLVERLDQSMKQARREAARVAVMFIDLDFFKQVNDTLGHAVGDRLLQAVAARMRLCVRETDTIARQGGDEFVVLLANIEDTSVASTVADKILAQMAAPFTLDDDEIHIGASIGITLFPDDGRDVETLFRNADLAMYRAKEAGRNNAQFFEVAMTTAAVERRALEADLRGALARGEFVLHYQPVIDLAAGRIVGAEALLRWRHPERGLVGPDRFVPLAEETGLIRDIGAWVFAAGCRQLAAWRDAGHRLTLAVNVSVRQLPEPLSVAHILATLARHGLEPRQIVLEITEGVLLADSPAVQEWFVAAGAAGLQLAIDDFGTGYSSLAYLKRFPVHHVKIDKAFVRDMATDPADRALVEAILAMAHSLGLSVVAEGVETAEQAGLLQTRACRFAQGYLYGRPVGAEEFFALLPKD